MLEYISTGQYVIDPLEETIKSGARSDLQERRQKELANSLSQERTESKLHCTDILAYENACRPDGLSKIL